MPTFDMFEREQGKLGLVLACVAGVQRGGRGEVVTYQLTIVYGLAHRESTCRSAVEHPPRRGNRFFPELTTTELNVFLDKILL